jgi:2-polyprenyl-6-hydroxyphenyl methylase/3-demethylubiquinone-9 3-methyltransferase
MRTSKFRRLAITGAAVASLAIVGAEWILGWIPRGTHDWSKFIRPMELDTALSRAGLNARSETGVMYNPLTSQWLITSDTDVNYMLVADKA